MRNLFDFEIAAVAGGGDDNWFGEVMPEDGSYSQGGDSGSSESSSPTYSQGLCVTTVTMVSTVGGAVVGGVVASAATEGIGAVAGANIGVRFGRAAGFALSAALCSP